MAAALGRMDLHRVKFDNQGRLRSRPRRRGTLVSPRDAVGPAMLFAYVHEQRAAVDFLLEKDGNWNMIGVNNGTALQRAAGSGDLALLIVLDRWDSATFVKIAGSADDNIWRDQRRIRALRVRRAPAPDRSGRGRCTNGVER